MEEETHTLILVLATVLTSLCYIHTITTKVLDKGLSKQLSIFPIICLFIALPLKLTSPSYCALTTFIISWLANFKLMLFAFDKGPLHSNPPIPLSHFIVVACFPVKTSVENKEKKKTLKSPLNYLSKSMLLLALVRFYELKEHYFHPKFALLCFCIHIYLSLEIILALFAYLAEHLAKLDIEPPFESPYMATSLRDFWGRRWNLTTSRILHLSVYQPVRSTLARSTSISVEVARHVAILATFFVSGLMHELVVYNVGRVWPSGEMLCFLLLHGASLSLEISIKQALGGRFQLPKAVSRVLTSSYLFLTSLWLLSIPNL